MVALIENGEAGSSVRSKLNQLITAFVATVTEYGAVGDGLTDDTAAIQAAIDSGRGPVFFPIGEYVVTQLEITYGTQLIGSGMASPPYPGTRLLQKPGSNLSLIVCDTSIPSDEWIHWAQISNMQLRGDKGGSSVGGCGIDMDRRTGECFLISDVLTNNFPESGIRLQRGTTPCRVVNISTSQNGEYGIDVQRGGGDSYTQCTIRSISGDDNGLALIRLKNFGTAEDQVTVADVKAEVNTAGLQQDIIVIDDANGIPISISNIQADCAETVNSLIKITTSSARVIVDNLRVSENCTYWIDDVANSTTLARGTGATACVVDGLWAGFLTDPASFIRTTADFVDP